MENEKSNSDSPISNLFDNPAESNQPTQPSDTTISSTLMDAIDSSTSVADTKNNNSNEPSQNTSSDKKASQNSSSAKSVSSSTSSGSDSDMSSQVTSEGDTNEISSQLNSKGGSSVSNSQVQSSSSSSNSIGNSSTASSAVLSAESLSAENKQLSRKEARVFRAGIDDEHDNEAEALSCFINSDKRLSDYIKSVLDNYKKKITKQELQAQLYNLSISHNQEIMGIKLLVDEYNNSVKQLSEQTDLLQHEHKNMKETNPQEELDVLLEWARTGMPHKIEQIYRQFSWIGNTPQFKSFMKENDLNKKYKLEPTSATQTKISSMSDAHSKANVAAQRHLSQAMVKEVINHGRLS